MIADADAGREERREGGGVGDQQRVVDGEEVRRAPEREDDDQQPPQQEDAAVAEEDQHRTARGTSCPVGTGPRRRGRRLPAPAVAWVPRSWSVVMRHPSALMTFCGTVSWTPSFARVVHHRGQRVERLGHVRLELQRHRRRRSCRPSTAASTSSLPPASVTQGSSLPAASKAPSAPSAPSSLLPRTAFTSGLPCRALPMSVCACCAVPDDDRGDDLGVGCGRRRVPPWRRSRAPPCRRCRARSPRR